MPLYLIVLFPLLGFIINGLLGARLKKPLPGIIATAAVLASFVVALLNVLRLASLPEDARRITETAYTWMSVGDFRVDVSFLLDQLSSVMILVITGIGFLIHLYSVGYMQDDHNDPEGRLYARYFGWLNLFIAFMSVLVLADNYLLMFVGWEGVGLCSYFLIGYWFKREDAAEASKKAFIMNRIGDFAFLLGMMLLFVSTGTLKYFGDSGAAGNATQGVLDVARSNAGAFSAVGLAGLGGITLITLLLFIGAAGKSAQIPLYTWLPDAMAGPTPVSALIHAATMVTAGVYMCARSAALFELAPETRLIIIVVGALTALFAGLTALAHNDIKKVLAYSTVSQLGFMFMGIGAGAYIAAIFHVFTHAFFKACLFLGAGSVIHALHGEQDMRKMGGLKAKMKATNITFMLSGLALAGAAPFAGFFSKDEIIAGVWNYSGEYNSIYKIIALVGLVTAFITALYTGRQYAQVFEGKARDEHLHDHAHESPSVMTVPLWLLAIGACFAGLLGLPHLPGVPNLHAFTDWLTPVFSVQADASHAAAGTGSHNPGATLMLLLVGAVIGWAGWFMGRSMGTRQGERAVLPASTHNLSLDAVYNATFARGGLALSAALRWIDDNIVDGIVNGIGGFFGQVSSALRLTQTSFVRNYALGMAVGAAVIIALFIINR
ncbi:MAG TPA: NADH-quinone oxidoreductase subunit L [Abditibacteriaceae bacterium]|jgi:NADH-quinone oxidoreductase subunit L